MKDDIYDEDDDQDSDVCEHGIGFDETCEECDALIAATRELPCPNPNSCGRHGECLRRGEGACERDRQLSSANEGVSK